MNILIVEDDDGIREVLVMLTSMDGHSVSQAATATEAIRLLERNDFDFVITDNDMPVDRLIVKADEGLRVVEFARLLPHRPHIAWMSGRASDEPALVQKARDLGADEILFKPFKPEEFRTIFHRASARKLLEMVPL